MSSDQPQAVTGVDLAKALADVPKVEFEREVVFNAATRSLRLVTGTAMPVMEGNRKLGVLLVLRGQRATATHSEKANI